MSLTTTEKISLDFYNQSIVIINAKQYDTVSRYINVTCTDHGKKAFLDPELTTAYVRFKKNDGNYIFNDTEILEDGTVLIELTQQMLTVTGRHNVDLMITSLTGVSANNLADMNSIYDMGATVISTMTFYLNVVNSTIENDVITSTTEYSALINAMARLARTEKDMLDLETLLNTQEEARQAAELKRQDNITGEAYRIAQEKARQAAELKRQDNITGEAYRIAQEKARQTSISQMQTQVNQAVTNAETATNNANTATNNCNTATARANEIADNLESNIISYVINDNIVSSSSTYSSQNIDSQLSTINSSIDNLINDNLSSSTATYSSKKIDSKISDIESSISGIINDAAASTTTTYSSSNIANQLNSLKTLMSAIIQSNVSEPQDQIVGGIWFAEESA